MNLPSFVPVSLLSAILLFAPTGTRANVREPALPAADLSRDVLREINRVRADPHAYAVYLETLRPLYRPDGYFQASPGAMLIRTREGVAALNEAIHFLQRAQPLPPWSYCEGLALSARDHAIEQGQTGQTGHAGRGGSSPFTRMGRYGAWANEAGENIAYGAPTALQVVRNLIVDDGVPNRGHRTNLLKPTFGVAGVGVGQHPRYGAVCVIDFATAFVTR
jgi:uncharacterized protein YkwD